MVQKQYSFGRNCTLNFEFSSFPGLVICDTVSWCWAVAVATAPVNQPLDHEYKQLKLHIVVLNAFSTYDGFIYT